jgi:DNA-binding LacI/PurR family transcriptional regulator
MAKVTIKEIAERARVSKTAVSFAFNYPERLSEGTLQQILAVAEELGYSPDPVASNLKTRRTSCIGILMPQPIPPIARNPHTLDFLEGVGETCHEAGLSLMLIPPLKGNLRRAIVRAAVDGFLTMGLETFRGTMVILQQRGVPFVMVDSDPTPGIPCVNTDDEAGAYAAMAYTLSMGHRRIAILGIRSGYHGNYEDYVGTLQRRIRGYLHALEEKGLTIDNHRVHLIECDCEAEGGYDAFQALWRGRWRPTAIVAMADIIAIGVMYAARDLGVHIPEDVSLIGHDDIAASRLTCPALTTVRQPTSEKGRVAAKLLIDLIEGKPVESEHTVLPVELIERQSFCALR